jgi:hypothetical protein
MTRGYAIQLVYENCTPIAMYARLLNYAMLILVAYSQGIPMSTLEDVLQEWQNNFQFRENFKKNPQQALADVGLTLADTDLQKIKVMLKLDDGKLDDRINK